MKPSSAIARSWTQSPSAWEWTDKRVRIYSGILLNTKGMELRYMLHHGWALKTSVRLTRHLTSQQISFFLPNCHHSSPSLYAPATPACSQFPRKAPCVTTSPGSLLPILLVYTGTSLLPGRLLWPTAAELDASVRSHGALSSILPSHAHSDVTACFLTISPTRLWASCSINQFIPRT